MKMCVRKSFTKQRKKKCISFLSSSFEFEMSGVRRMLKVEVKISLAKNLSSCGAGNYLMIVLRLLRKTPSRKSRDWSERRRRRRKKSEKLAVVEN
jgi:hypothetical protein